MVLERVSIVVCADFGECITKRNVGSGDAFCSRTDLITDCEGSVDAGTATMM